MMRVAHVTPVFPPYRGGMGTVAHQQARALAEAGVDVTVMTPRLRSPRHRPPGVSVREMTALVRRGLDGDNVIDELGVRTGLIKEAGTELDEIEAQLDKLLSGASK